MSKEELVSIGARLRAVRQHLGIKQNAMADGLGISAAHLSEIENGKSSPSAEIFLNMGKTYNINLDYLFLERGKMLYSMGPDKKYDFDQLVNSIDKLVWMMEESMYFKTLILAAAQKAMIAEGDIIRESVTLKKKPT
jgi:transcriptional regulator with XRE-family HTH domain